MKMPKSHMSSMYISLFVLSTLLVGCASSVPKKVDTETGAAEVKEIRVSEFILGAGDTDNCLQAG